VPFGLLPQAIRNRILIAQNEMTEMGLKSFILLFFLD
jgi:hypothetical protein